MTRQRCFGTGDPLYEAYHDEEWGHPAPDSPDERELFERIALEGFQSGLSWITVLRKRPRFREVFHDFAPAAVAAFDESDIERLLGDPGIVRNRLKIEATISNAKAMLAMHERGERLAEVIAAHTPPPRGRAPERDEVAVQTPESAELSRSLKKLGFRFVGPTTAYATMQAVGAVDDHVVGCWLAQR
ncbi:DNA-3-methyladenine glycosylase I [Tessaracoccus defluvii]|uniref:DNA-3-methyladenine glycosylase I n=1 Tax=Tessaracoccus defluvii TaxID=1285901 RepID=A0A7H0H2B7_9ACTN|nr:DNA-3-methyladenine glycosylase I [Tessaracoccus defluvii]QNP54683.1 DNA-3-methyladenine glycosylase I [Tessaracoccus defluvii]